MAKGVVRFKIGRSAGSGRFKTVKWARDHKQTAVVETIVKKKKPA